MEKLRSNPFDREGLVCACLLKGSREKYLVKKIREKISWEHPRQLRKDSKIKNFVVFGVKKPVT